MTTATLTRFLCVLLVVLALLDMYNHGWEEGFGEGVNVAWRIAMDDEDDDYTPTGEGDGDDDDAPEDRMEFPGRDE